MARRSLSIFKLTVLRRSMDIECSHVGFLGEFDFSNLLSLGHHVLVLDTHKTTTVAFVEGEVLVVVGHEGLLEGVEVLHVLLSGIGQGNAGGCLEVNELAEVVLALDDAVGDTLGLAQGWQERHELDWLDVTGDGDELGLAFLDQGGDVVETEFKMVWLWTNVVGLVAALSGLGLRLESVLLLRLGLWRVLSKKLEKLGLLVLLNSLGEDVELWWTLESHEKHSLLSLDSDVLWPFNIPGQVSHWLDVSTDSEVSSSLLEERSSSSRLGSGSGGDDLLSFLSGTLWHVFI